MTRSEITIDRAAIRHNTARLRDLVGPAELWAVVKADGYGHGALDAGAAALEGGASVLCVATAQEGARLRERIPDARLLVLGPTGEEGRSLARAARLELVVGAGDGGLPEGVPLHLKLDTGMGRWGLGELVEPTRDVVGLMTHFAASDTEVAFTREQLDRFVVATAGRPAMTRHAANSAAALSLPESRLDAVRCGIALYGIDPFGVDAARHGLRPALAWRSELARVVELQPGESTGYGRRFVATEPTWVGIVPVGYADGFRRGLTGTSVVVAAEPCEVVGTISMDALAVVLPCELPVGTPVELVGSGATLERHAAVAGTIAYELVCGIRTDADRSVRMVVG